MRPIGLLLVLAAVGCDASNEETGRFAAAARAASESAGIAEHAGVHTPPFVVRELFAEGNLPALLREEAAHAERLGLRPVVYFHGSWCGPCRAFTTGLADPRMRQALDGTYLVKLNVDDWSREERHAIGLYVHEVPAFARIDSRGRVSGAVLTGEAWKKSVPEEMAPALARFFAA
jgi:thiol-disulfide isomerase/thioredoxin